jgi:hypothetical protein
MANRETLINFTVQTKFNWFWKFITWIEYKSREINKSHCAIGPHLADPTRHSCLPIVKNRGRGFPWHRAAARGSNPATTVLGWGEQAWEVAGEATHQFGVSGWGVAHRRGCSTVVQSSNGESTMARRRRAWDHRWSGRRAPRGRGGGWGNGGGSRR